MASPHIKIDQPHGVLFSGKQGKAELKFKSNFATERTENYTNAQRWVDSEVLRLCDPYTPFLTGILKFSGTLSTDIGSGFVTWGVPYARYQYYGKVVLRSPFGGGPIYTKRPLKYHGGGKRGSHWFERMKEVSGQDIIDGAKKIAGRS